MNGYKAFYSDKTTDIHAESQYEAKQKAVAFFKVPPKKSHMVSVMLCEVDGRQVIHTPN